MDIFEQFIRDNCWKFPKGYPDINNSEDKRLLFKLLEEIQIPVTEVAKDDYNTLFP